MALSAVNMILPRIIQRFIDGYLKVGNATERIIFYFAGLYLAAVLLKSIVWFFKHIFIQKRLSVRFNIFV